jgi:cysteine desulfuration protein SufE
MSAKPVSQMEKEIIEEFSFFSEWNDKYEYIIELGKKLKDFPEDKHTDSNKVRGCQSSVWLTADTVNGVIVFKADSDSVIVKGLIALLIRVLSGRTPDEILEAKLDFIDAIGLKQHLAGTRANGLAAMIKQIKMYAMAYKAKRELETK